MAPLTFDYVGGALLQAVQLVQVSCLDAVLHIWVIYVWARGWRRACVVVRVQRGYVYVCAGRWGGGRGALRRFARGSGDQRSPVAHR